MVVVAIIAVTVAAIVMIAAAMRGGVWMTERRTIDRAQRPIRIFIILVDTTPGRGTVVRDRSLTCTGIQAINSITNKLK